MIPSIKKTFNVKLAKGVPNGCECCGIFFVSFKGCPYVTSSTKYVTNTYVSYLLKWYDQDQTQHGYEIFYGSQ